MRAWSWKRVAALSALSIAVGLVAVKRTDAGEWRGDRGDGDGHEFDWRVVQGFRISPVKLALRKGDARKVGLGSYLVNAVGGCNDCHTAPSYVPDNGPFLGQPYRINTENYLAGGRVFGPGLVSANITPDAQTGLPAGLTWDEFREAIRTGRDPDGSGRILQVMPWPVYGNMLDDDLAAIYAYLSAIPHAEPAPTPAP